MMVNIQDKVIVIFYKNFIAGTAWALGATVGFALLATVMSFLFGKIGGLPVIGEFVASLVEVTREALIKRNF